MEEDEEEEEEEIFPNFWSRQLVMMNYECDFSQSDMEKYFERMIIVLVYSHEVISTESEKKPLKNDLFD